MIRFLDILAALLNWSYAFLFFWILRSFLSLKKPLILQLLAFAESSVFSLMIIYPQDIVNLAGALLAFFAYVLLFGRGKWVEKLSAILIFYPALIAVNYLTQDVASRLFFSLTGFENPDLGWTNQQLLISSVFYLVSSLLRLLFWAGAWLALRKYLQQMKAQLTTKMWLIVDTLMLAAFVAILVIVCSVPKTPLLAYPVCIASVFTSFGCIYLVSYIYSTVQSEYHTKELQLQQSYLKDRLQEEERVRSIYHDMKNHLLLLEEQTKNSVETSQSIIALQKEIEEYENYYHTGNLSLDIIIREKSRLAREKQVDFSANLHFEYGNFLQPLDISTIFGNALDNALEACEKLPAGERLITLKAARVHDFLVIMLENSMEKNAPASGRTSKDPFLHGFGLSNMKKAAEKYDGQCTAKAEKGIFTLKFVIPIPEKI